MSLSAFEFGNAWEMFSADPKQGMPSAQLLGYPLLKVEVLSLVAESE